MGTDTTTTDTQKDKLEQKLELFEYVVFKLIEWFKEKKGENYTIEEFNKDPKNDFSTLKLMKLLFFVSSISTQPSPSLLDYINLKDEDESKDDLLDIFNNFVALQYGHVEYDVYKNIDTTKHFKIPRTNSQLEIRNHQVSWPKLTPNVRPNHKELFPYIKKVDEAVEKLKKANPSLVTYTSSRLVDISHKWYSWKLTYNKDNAKDISGPTKIKSSFIREEPKIFF